MVVQTHADWIKKKIRDVYGYLFLPPDVEVFIELNSRGIIDDAHKLDQFGFRLDWTEDDQKEWSCLAVDIMERHKFQDSCHTLNEPF